ncbi:MAG TPA: GAF domain-containing sensor histidine kinase [bacterium]|nr:GAF domain-containing sensor histidine kinase [bacterium]
MAVLPTFTQAVVSLRWLALAALIAIETLLPGGGSSSRLISLYAAIFGYTLALSLVALRYPEAHAAITRLGIPLDTLTIAAGMLISGHGREFLLLAFPVTAVAGLLLGYPGALLAGAAVAAVQFPVLRTSLFAPAGYVLWGFAALALLGTGSAAAGAAQHLARRQRFERLLSALRRAAGAAPNTGSAARAGLSILAGHFRAQSGSLMLFDPPSGRLEILAGMGLDRAYEEVRARLDEGIAGWVVQQGRAVLLTPESPVPFPLERPRIGTSVCVPLRGGQGPLGLLSLNRHRPAARFSRDDLEAVEIAAQQIAGALLQAQHERLYAAALSEVAEGFSEVSRALARDPVVLWPALLDIARSLTSAPFAVLALEREDTGNVDIVATRGIDGRTASEFATTLLAASTHGEIRVAQGGPLRNGVPTSVACIPLRADAQILGAIGLGLGEGRVPPRLLQAVASHVAAAVHTARSAYRIADIGVLEERRRIAREMHDGLAQTLADALLQTDLSGMAAQANPEQVAGDLRELRGVLERAMRELREFMTDLRRHDQAERTLFGALDQMGREFGRRYEIPTSTAAAGDDGQLPSAIRHAVLAIARQALTNVHAHAQATAVEIRGEVTEQACTVSVKDNGVGFDPAAFRANPPSSHHLGLTSMEERAALVGGRVRVDSRPGGGTTVTIHIPLGREHDQDTRAAGG